jgi:predicted regulator of Ras-like GTPase activity (Roadblock/LC7/MglB family)
VAIALVDGTLNQIIAQLRRLPDVLAVIIARRDGLVIASNLSRRSNPKKVAAMAASIVGTSEMAVGELEQGTFREVMVESDEGTVLGIGAGEEAILIALVRKDANVGLVLLNLERSANEIREFLDSTDGRDFLDGSTRRTDG